MLRTSPMPMLWNESSMKFWIAVNIDATRSGSLSEGRLREMWTRGVPPEAVRYMCLTVRRNGCGSLATPPRRVGAINSFGGYYPPRYRQTRRSRAMVRSVDCTSWTDGVQGQLCAGALCECDIPSRYPPKPMPHVRTG